LAEFDGSIRINTKIENTEVRTFDVEIKRLIETISKLSTVIENAVSKFDFSDLKRSVKEAEKGVDTVGKNLDDSAQSAKLFTDEIEKIPIQRWNDIENEITNTNEQMKNLNDTQTKIKEGLDSSAQSGQLFTEEMGKIPIQRWNDAQEEISSTSEQITILSNNLSSVGEAIIPVKEGIIGLSGSTGEIADSANREIGDIENTIIYLKDFFINIPNTLSGIKGVIAKNITSNFESEKERIVRLVDELKLAKSQLKNLEETGFDMGTEEWEGTHLRIKEIEKELSGYKDKLEGVDGKTKKVEESTKKVKKQVSKVKDTGNISALGEKFDQLKKRITRLAVSTLVFNVLRRGLSSLSAYLTSVLKTNKQFTGSLAKIKGNLLTAFQPIYEAILPALNVFMNGLAKVTSYLAMFTSMLFGKSVKDSAKNAESLYNQAKAGGEAADSQRDLAEATEEAEEAAKGALASFDKLNILEKNDTDKGTGSKPSTGGTTSSKPDFSGIGDVGKESEALNKFKNILEKLKKALEPTIEALKRLKKALEPLKDFTIQALKDFYEYCLVPIGEWVLGEGLPRFIDALTQGLEQVDWTKLNRALVELFKGISAFTIGIGEGLLVIWERFLVPLGVWVLGEGLPNFVRIVGEGLQKINFEKINTALGGLMDALLPFAINIGEGLLWFFENVLVPLSLWTINEVLPVFLDGLATILEIINTVIEAMKPSVEFLWNNFLLPLAKFTGGIIVDVLEGIVKGLKSFSTWAKEHKGVVEFVTTLILGFFAGIWMYNTGKNLIGFLTQLVPALMKFGGSLKTLGENGTLAAGAVGATLFAILQLAQNWDKLNGAEKVAGAIGGVIAVGFAAALALGAFQSALTMGVAALAITAGIAAIMFSIESAKSRAGKATSSMTLQQQSYGNSFSLPSNVPMLAQGSVVEPNKQFMAILGDNTREHEIVSPISAMKQAFKEAQVEMGGNQRRQGPISQKAVLELDGKALGTVIFPYIEKEGERLGVRLVTGGI
jgi:hypothetical protein